MKTRTFGWVQNPANFNNLKKLVQIFVPASSHYKELKNHLLPKYIKDSSKLSQLIQVLEQIPIELTYTQLVGTGTSKRADALCDALVQASIPDQGNKKGYIDNWSSDGFVRWAECLGLIQYHRNRDSFTLTEQGALFAEENSPDEIIIDALLSYPPAIRVLQLLSDAGGSLLTKFEIGSQLGFAGENGFTSLPENLLVESLFDAHSSSEKNKIRADWEGSSDKYARMICGWLASFQLVKKERKYFTNPGYPRAEEYISHAFKITMKGMNVYKKSLGMSKHAQITKNVSWEMLATKVENRNYIRMRRAYLLKYLQNNNTAKLEELFKHLQTKGFNDPIPVLKNDIKGFIGMGLQIQEIYADTYKLKDLLNDFSIPALNVTEELKNTEILELKAHLTKELSSIDNKYIELVEIAYDSKQHRFFEMQVMNLLVNCYGYRGKHLGGTRKPDGIAYTDNYGIIIDTKAYEKGYSLPMEQADEMRRYVEENKSRSPLINKNLWWQAFPPQLTTFYFLFITSKLTGGFQNRLENIKLTTKVKGAAISITELLKGANLIQSGNLTLSDIEPLFCAEEIKFVP